MLTKSQYENGKDVVQNNYGIDRAKFIAVANAYLFAGTDNGKGEKTPIEN